MKEKDVMAVQFPDNRRSLFAVIAIFIIVVSAGMNPYGSWSLAPGLFPLIMGVNPKL